VTKLQQVNLDADVLANRPAFGSEGRLFFATDVPMLYRDTGSAWEDYASGGAFDSSYYDPDYPPVATGTYNDEFNDDSIDAAWSFTGGADENFNLYDNGAGVHRSETIYHGFMLLQACSMARAFTPSIGQDFTLVCKANMSYDPGSNESYMRMRIEGQTVNHYYDLRVGRYNGYDQVRTVYNNGGGAAQGALDSWSIRGPMYLMVTHDGAENFSSFVSGDGFVWSIIELDRNLSNMNSFVSFQISISGGGNPDPMMAVDFVRYFDNEGTYKIGRDR